jgi:FAD/FMN-containing dehydrogenase
MIHYLPSVFLPFLYSIVSSLQARPRLLSHLHLHLANADAVNATVMEACKSLTPQTKVFYPSDDKKYNIGTKRYMKSSSQEATCVFIPTLSSELSDAIKLIGQRRIQFAVSSGGHTSNAGFSSTTGIMISLKGFQHVHLSGDKSYVDIGAGNIWDNVYQVLEGM